MKIKDINKSDIQDEIDYKRTGFQATKIGIAKDIMKKIKDRGGKTFLSFTSNMVASGLRGVFKELCKQNLVDVVITAGGSVDHDIIKSKIDYKLGSFRGKEDEELHKKGLNRIGNILISNDGYEELEEFVYDVFEEGMTSPSELIYNIGKELDEDSFLYWCSKNDIPVFCPGITDSAIGLNSYFYKQDKDFGIDVTEDMEELGQIVLDAQKTSGIILGGGISKHHTIGSNILRGGMDYAIYITTSSPWDGSLSGAKSEEAVSWGKIKEEARHVTVIGDATVVFPIVVSEIIEDNE